MSDFRQELYRRYVTTFKATQHQKNSNRELQSYWASCKHKYLPLLSGLDRNDPILDLGCGPGRMLEFLKVLGFSKVEGVDISEEQVQIAIGRGLDVKAVDVFEFLRSKERAYSAIIAMDFLEHFSKEELMRLFSSIHKALKEGGVLIIGTPNGQGLFPNQVIYGDWTHLTIFAPDSLRQILTLMGFDEIKYWETGPIAQSIGGGIRVVLWELIKLVAKTVRKIETGKKQEIWTENMICRCRKRDIGSV